MDEWWKRGEEIADGSRGGREFMPEETSIQFKVKVRATRCHVQNREYREFRASECWWWTLEKYAWMVRPGRES
jgi:hypothetical protein